MSAYKCQLCYMPFKLSDDNVCEKYQCECGNNVCDLCIDKNDSGEIKCKKCLDIHYEVFNPDYDCVCEICEDYNGDGVGIEKDEHGLDCYMCSCCKNGCWVDDDDGDDDNQECRCWEVLLAAREINLNETCADETCADETCADK